MWGLDSLNSIQNVESQISFTVNLMLLMASSYFIVNHWFFSKCSSVDTFDFHSNLFFLLQTIYCFIYLFYRSCRSTSSSSYFNAIILDYICSFGNYSSVFDSFEAHISRPNIVSEVSQHINHINIISLVSPLHFQHYATNFYYIQSFKAILEYSNTLWNPKKVYGEIC
jgi:hypothetical protein